MARRETASPSASRLANLVAPPIARAFDAYQDGFGSITRRGGERFARRDWPGTVADAVERLELYGHVIDGIERDVRQTLGARVTDSLLWAGIKAVYSGLIAGRQDWELAESFFNSVTRRIFANVGVDPDVDFVDTDFEAPALASESDVCQQYRSSSDVSELIEGVLLDAVFDAPFEDLPRDARLVAKRLADHVRSLRLADAPVERAEIVRAPFYRRKGAYLVGRVFAAEAPVPLALALLNTERGVVVDAVLMDEDDLSILFSFTRSHFHVDAGPAYRLVRFLKTLMPHKPIAELYIAVGYHKHGKTELYRDLLAHLRAGEERFELARGTPGMVMVVFTLPGHDVVFKVIRDQFASPKTVNRAEVLRKYRLVFQHDRAGRLVEAQEFEHLKFDRSRFAEDLLVELQREAGKTVAVGPDHVVVRHAYVERRVTPLDLFVREASADAARAGVVDFGQALKDLAATNIFPGDLLPKNFGLTRHGRVVCYDYDELGLLTDFCFREMPSSDAYDDELSDEAWFGAGPADVFPNEFPRFLGLPPALREELATIHGELYEVEFWKRMQARVNEGEIVDIFPYQPSRRLGALER